MQAYRQTLNIRDALRNQYSISWGIFRFVVVVFCFCFCFLWQNFFFVVVVSVSACVCVCAWVRACVCVCVLLLCRLSTAPKQWLDQLFVTSSFLNYRPAKVYWKTVRRAFVCIASDEKDADWTVVSVIVYTSVRASLHSYLCTFVDPVVLYYLCTPGSR